MNSDWFDIAQWKQIIRAVGCALLRMSQFYWQNVVQNTTQQFGSKDCVCSGTNSDDQWSCVGLTNERPEQRTNWWLQHSESGTDPYSAAAFEGFSASLGNVETANRWPAAANAHISNANLLSEHQPEQKVLSVERSDISKSGLHEDGNVQHQFGIHQPILDFKYKSSAVSNVETLEDDKKMNKKGSEHLAQSCNVLEGDECINVSSSEKELLATATEPQIVVPSVAVAQVTPIIAMSLPTTAETPVVQSSGTLTYTQTSTISAAPHAANVARVGPIANQQNDTLVSHFGSTVSAVSCDPPPVTSYVENSTLILREENIGTPITATASALKEQELTIETAPVNSGEVFSGSPKSPPLTVNTHGVPPVQDEMNLLREEEANKQENVVLLTSAEHSTDSTALEDSISEVPSEKHKDSKNVRDRYRIIRQQYPEVVKRLDRLRMETRSLDCHTVKRGATLEIDSGSHPSLVQKNRAAPISFDRNVSVNAGNTEPTLDFRPSTKMNHSYTVPENMGTEDNSTKNDTCYGDELVNSLRRSRHSRARVLDYFPFRGTKSEMGEVGPYRGPALAMYKQYMMPKHSHGNISVPHDRPSSEFHPSGWNSLGSHSGRRTAQELMMYADENFLPRRPQSSFDASACAKYQNLNEHVDNNCRENQLHHSENEDESSGNDSEIARIHYEQEMTRRAAAMGHNTMPVAVPNEYYYFGVIQLPQQRVEHIMYRMPPPSEYYQLPPIEKAAYLFYCALYQRHYQPVDLFHKKFNREYYRYICEGDSAEIALWKICRHTQEEFLSKRSANLKAYEMSQKQLFSDDRETLDSRQSERGSRCDPEEESDKLSADSPAREPMKFRAAHSFLRFGVGGKVILLNVQNSEKILEIRDLKSLLDDQKLLRNSNAVESFRGPLIAGSTPTHSVRLYVQRQIELIQKSEIYRSSASGGMASDCLLVWKLLEMLVQQQGRVTGPDLARLLMAADQQVEHRRNRNMKYNSLSPPNETVVDSQAYDRFTQLLLGGHIKEALEGAIKDGLYSDAMILARRICAKEPQELEKIETAILSHRSEHNPIMTLFSVANGQPAPVLASPPLDEAGGWRSHAAIILANLNTAAALGTVYQLGHVLARRELYAAADFCFLSVNLLVPGYDPFKPLSKSKDEGVEIQQHITLIHATMPNDEALNLRCSKGFSILDLHATEIFEFATRLANNGNPVNLSGSVAYQLCRLDYAEIISEMGATATDVFHYCVEIARGIWDLRHEIDIENLERLYELAESLKFVASADASSTAWLPAMQSLIEERRKVSEESCIVKRDVSSPYIEDHESVKVEVKEESTGNQNQRQDAAITSSVNAEVVKWDIGHQESVTTTSSSVKEQEMKLEKHESIEYGMQPTKVNARTRTYSNASASVHNSQYPKAPPPVLPSSFMETSEISNQMQTTVTTSTTSHQTSEHSSRNVIPSYYDDSSTGGRNSIEDPRITDCRGGDIEMPTEVTTTDGITVTNSHELSQRRNGDLLETKVFDGNLIEEGVLQKGAIPPPASANSSSNQFRNHIPERSHTSWEQSDAPKNSEKMNSKSRNSKDHRQNAGLFSKIKATIAKAIPSSNEMILPDDKNPTIIWDPKLNRYVGEGIEEEPVPEPPPSVATSLGSFSGSTYDSTGGLTAARLGGGSRYFNPLIQTISSKPTMQDTPLLPPVPVTATFGFIPSMPDCNDGPSESPFSVATVPEIQESEVAK